MMVGDTGFEPVTPCLEGKCSEPTELISRRGCKDRIFSDYHQTLPDIPAPPPRITGLGGCRETLRELGGTARSRPRLPDSGKKLQETSPKAADYLQKRPVLQETSHLLDLLLHSVSLWGGQLPLLPATSTPRRALQSSNAEIARNRRARARRWCQTLPDCCHRAGFAGESCQVP